MLSAAKGVGHVRLAFTRLYKVKRMQGLPAGIVLANIYPISTALSIVVRGLIDVPGAISFFRLRALRGWMRA